MISWLIIVNKIKGNIKYNKNSLENLIKKEKKQNDMIKKRSWQKRILRKLYYPSIDSFIITFLIVFLLMLISHFFGGLINYPENINIISIHSGIGVIIIALLIFVAENLRDSNDKYKAQIFLREGFIFPLTVAEITIFILVICYIHSSFFIIPVIIIAFITILSLGRIIKLLLNNYTLEKKRIELFKDNLHRSISTALDERLGENIFLDKIKDYKIKLDYPVLPIEKNNYYVFKSVKEGFVKDINLDKLKDFVNIVEMHQFDNEDVNVDNEMSAENSEERSLKIREENYGYINKKYHDDVSQENNDLIYIKKELVINDELLINKLEKMVSKIFRISDINNFTEEMRYDLSSIKDQFALAIENKQTGKLEKLIKIYVALAEEFLEYIGGFSVKQAYNEIHLLNGGWQEVKWLSSDLRDLYFKAMATDDIEVIRKVGYLPISIIKRAIEEEDHYLYQEFLFFPTYIYNCALQKEDKKLKNIMIDRSWRYIKELVELYLEYKLNYEKLSIDELKNLKGFTIYVFKPFQRLLKTSLDNYDIDTYKVFMNVVMELFNRFHPSNSVYNFQDLEWQLNNSELDNQEIDNLKKSLHKQKTLEEIEQEIKDKKSQLIFGFSSWILNKLITDIKLKEVFLITIEKLPKNINELAKIFLDSRKDTVENFWGWDWWDIPADGKAHYNDFTRKFAELFILKILYIIESKNNKSIEFISIDYNSDFLNLLKGDNGLLYVLENIKNDIDKYKIVLSEKNIEDLSVLKKILLRTKEDQEKKELDLKRKREISAKKITFFIEEFKKGFYRTASMRNIFKDFKLYKDKSNGFSSGKKFGVNRIDDKAVFIENWPVSYLGWGDHYGNNLAVGENINLYTKISKKCNIVDKSDFEKTLDKFKNTKNILIITTYSTFYKFFRMSDNYIPKWKTKNDISKNKFIEGYYEHNNTQIPIYNVNIQNIAKEIIILNKAKLGYLIQQSPLNEEENTNMREEIFYIDIKSFSNNGEVLNKFIEDPPEWLKDVSPEKREDHLKERVWIRIFERFKLNTVANFEGYKIVFKN